MHQTNDSICCRFRLSLMSKLCTSCTLWLHLHYMQWLHWLFWIVHMESFTIYFGVWWPLPSLSEAICSSKWPPRWSAFGGHLEGQMASEKELNIAQGGAITHQSKWWIDSRWTIWFILKPISGQYHFLWKASTCLAREHLSSTLLLQQPC